MKIFENKNKIIEIGVGEIPESGCFGPFQIKVHCFLFFWVSIAKPTLSFLNKDR